MPAESKKQRKVMAIAKHHPEKLYERNKGLKQMSKSQLHDYASTKEKKLPMKKIKGKKFRIRRKIRPKLSKGMPSKQD